MMKMMVRSVVVAVVLATGSLGASAASPKTSPAFADQFTAAEAARGAKRWADVEAKAREVLASSTRKAPDDVYAAHYYLLEVAKAKSNTPAIIESLEAMLGSGFSMTVPEQNTFRTALVSAYYAVKNFQQAIKHGTDLIRNGGANEDVYTVVGQSYYQTKNYGEAVKLFEGLVSAAEKAGRKPDRRQLALLQDAYAKAGNAEAAQTTLEKLVRHYPTADTWNVLLYEVKKERLDPRQKVQLYRLMDATGNLKHPADITAYSDAATSLGLFEEANRALEVGKKLNVFKAADELSRADRYLKSNATRAAEARAELPEMATAAKAAPTGNEYVALGMQYFSFGEYAKAVEATKAGIAKGGLKNLDDNQVLLGIAQMKAGQKADAVQTLRAVKTDNAVTLRIAKLWALYASS
jgi:tetratricopeptide (TPR) repeat protein